MYIQIEGMQESMVGMMDDSNLQDIEGFTIFKTIKNELDSSSVRGDDSLQGEDLLPSSTDPLLLNEDSISSMDIDLNALEKVTLHIATMTQ